MKLKTLHLFYLNQSNKYSREVFWASLLLFFPFFAFSQGLYSNFESLVKNQQQKFSQTLIQLKNQDFSLDNIADINKVKLDPSYINLLIQNSPARYVLLAKNDRCSLYDLLQTSLLGDVEYLLINYLDKNNQKQVRSLSKDQFLGKVAIKQCPNLKKFQEHFSAQNARRTLKDMKLIPPSTKDECYNLFESFKKDLKSPYLCDMIEKIRSTKSLNLSLNKLAKTDYKERSKLQQRLIEVDSYNKVLTPAAKKLLNGLCLNLNTPQYFCYQYFNKSFWSDSFQKDNNSEILRSFCKGINKKKCIGILNSSPEFCHFAGSDYPSLLPKPNCADISRALLKSNTNHLANDCPLKVGNDAVTSFSRVLNSYQNLSKQEYSCEANSTLPFATFSGEINDYESWNTNLCFLNKLDNNNKVCYPVIYSEVEGSQLSVSSVVTKIAERTKGFNDGKCHLIYKKDYKPALLQYRSGCHIILDEKNCFGTDCKMQVILDQKDLHQIITENNLEFNLFPYDFINENKSLVKMYAKMKKINLKTIKNISSYLFVKEKHPKANFIGIGCREDLLPNFFTRKVFNQCIPLSFTLDGFFKDQGSYSIVTRTGLDQIHAPRIIPWPYIFNAVKNYQELHPIKIWGLYALY